MHRMFVFLFLYVFLMGACYSRSEYMSGFRDTSPKVEAEPSKAEMKRKWKMGLVYVTKVIDGDTFWVDNGTESFKVRFIGIDAPEIRNSRWKQKGYYANEAKTYVAQLTEKKWVRLQMDVQKQDRYQRTLAYIHLEDGTFLNADLVANGYAVVDTYPPNIAYVDLFVELQKEAREEKRGLWAKDIIE